MPFYGVLPEREHLFRPQPARDTPVSDAEAWRLNPDHRQVYDKLRLALLQGLVAAPCGVTPASLGVAPDAQVFVKPIVNLAGMALEAGLCRADAVPVRPGHFWSRYLTGPHTSTDCLVRDGRVLWFAHTLASAQKNRHRPVYWHIGPSLPGLEPRIEELLARLLPGYTGLCNLELIGGHAIEVHLRGSNGFFDFYGPEFLPAWVRLVDMGVWKGLEPPGEGFVFSWFSDRPLPPGAEGLAKAHGVTLVPDTYTCDRSAILYAPSKTAGEQALQELEHASNSHRQ